MRHQARFETTSTKGVALDSVRRERKRAQHAAVMRAISGAALATTMAIVPFATHVAAAAPRATAVASPHLVTVSAAPLLPRGASVVASVAPTSQVSGAIALKLPHEQALSAFIGQASNPRSPMYRHYLGPGQFKSRFGPATATIAAAEHALTTLGLAVSNVSANGLLIQFRASASTVESAFHTGLEQVRLANGSMGRATTSAVELPGNIAAEVQAVVGLDELVTESSDPVFSSGTHHSVTAAAAASHADVNGGPVACSNASMQQQNGAITDQQIAEVYGVEGLYNAGDLGAGQTIDVYELEPFAMSDIEEFDNCYFLENNTGNITVTDVDGGPGVGSGSAEAALDIEDVAAIAPEAKIDVFEGPNMDNSFGPLDTWNQIAVIDNARQVTSSWGGCAPLLEQGAPGVEQVENEIFEQMAAQGQTVFAAAGDDGSDDCAAHGSTGVAPDLSVNDPADQPDVTSVGGTTITDATVPPTETVWNNGNDGGAGGGGLSTGWAMQPWQAGVALPQTDATEVCSNDPTGTADDYHLAGIDTTLPAGTPCRESPDVSALADPQTGITIVYGGQWYQIGGTSSATPLWAAMLAEINASAACAGSPDGVGFADPALYQVAGIETTYADAFNDVTVGNNDNLSVGAAEGEPYAAGPGYDMASGLGTPRVTNDTNTGLGEQLCDLATSDAQPSVTSLQTDQTIEHGGLPSGPTTGGTTVYVNGTNFGAAEDSGAVYFGSVAAVVTSWSATQITVTAPAYYGPPGTPAGAAGGADVVVVTAAHASSPPISDSTFLYTGAVTGSPVIDYVSTPAGATTGGNDVTIVGSDLTGATSVTFGGVAATINGAPVGGNPSDELTVTVPPESDSTDCANSNNGVCAVAVVVTTTTGSSPSAPILPAFAGPLIFNPDGSFTPACLSDATCEVSPAPEEYDYAPTPTVTAISPGYSSEYGGSVVTLTGSGFNLLTVEWVNVGPSFANASEDFYVLGVTPDQLTVVVPPDDNPSAPTVEPDTAPLSVQTAGGLSAAVALWYAGAPGFTSITRPSPPIAPQADPGTLTVTGAGLSDVTSVVFQGVEPLEFLSSTTSDITAQSDTSLTVAVPQFFAWPADVLLCSATSCTFPSTFNGSNADVFTLAYPGQPVVRSSGPSSGPARGGSRVVIQGSLDSEVTSVLFGTVPGTIINQPELTASGPIYVLAPRGVAGRRVDITIETAGGELVGHKRSAATPAATFTYLRSSPSAPGVVVATPGPGLVAAHWSVPRSDGGAPITGYRVTVSAGRNDSVTRSVGASQRQTLFASLAHVTWQVSVQAINRLGDGPAALSRSVTPAATPLQGYWLATASGAVYAVGYAKSFKAATASSADPVVGIASAPGGAGYWLVTRDGLVIARGSARSAGELHKGVRDIVSIVATEDGFGYWLLGANGRIYPFGDAGFFGDLLHESGGRADHVDDAVAMAALPSGLGYLIVESDGRVHSFGTAHDLGNAHATDVAGIALAPTGDGYVLYLSNGGTYEFGRRSGFAGNLVQRHIVSTTIVGLARTPDGRGYWMVDASGDTYAFKDAIVLGTPSRVSSQLPVVGIAAT
jgi:hypothetical protein